MTREKKVARFGSIFLLNLGVKLIIDYPLNAYLMSAFGYLISLTSTTIIYIIIGIFSVRIYDHFGIDLVNVERNKKYFQVKIEEGKKFLAFYSILKVFVRGLLVGLKNTGFVVIIFRKGSFLFNGFEGKYIILIFLSYALLINVAWNLIVQKYYYLWEQLLDIIYKSFVYWADLYRYALENTYHLNGVF